MSWRGNYSNPQDVFAWPLGNRLFFSELADVPEEATNEQWEARVLANTQLV